MGRLNQVLQKANNHKFVMFLVCICFTLLIIESSERGDFDIFLEASADLLKGKNIYQQKYHDWYHYYYDVLFAIIITPLRSIPLYFANFIWILLSLILSYRTWKIVEDFISLKELTGKRAIRITTISLIFIFALWHKNLHLTQMTIFILYLCLEGMYQIYIRNHLLGSILISLGITIKILPIVLIPYLLYRAQFRPVLYILCTIPLLLLLPSLIIGHDYNLFLLHGRWTLINPANAEHILDVSESSFHSITTLLSTLLIEDTGNPNSLNLKRNIADLDVNSLKYFILMTRIALVSSVLFVLRSKPFKKSLDKRHVFYELSYIFVLVPLIFPHQQHYAFYFIFPAITYLIYFYYHRFEQSWENYPLLKRVLVVLTVFIIYFFLNSNFVLGAFRDYYDHYKILTYGALILLPLLLYARPDKLEAK